MTLVRSAGVIMNPHEEWTLNEIKRLRADAQRASAEADALQRAFDKRRELQGAPLNENVKFGSPSEGAYGHAASPRRQRRSTTTYGSKNAVAIQQIKDAPDGMTIDEIYRVFAEKYGEAYKRSSLRALLWNQKQSGK